MKATKFTKTLIAAATFSAVFAAFNAGAAENYGRAGGAVGAERIQQLATVTAKQQTQTPDLSNQYGRAGGAVGVQRVAGVTKAKTYAAGKVNTPTVYGRAGVPLPFGG